MANTPFFAMIHRQIACLLPDPDPDPRLK